MRKSYAKICKSANFKYNILSIFKNNSALFISLLIFFMIGLLTGIFVAIKCGVSISTISDYNLEIYSCNSANCFSSFCSRLFSAVINLLILWISSLYVLLIPLGYLLTTYRGYLVGFNCALLVCLFGISGAITSVIVVLPCQLVLSFVFILYFVLCINNSVQRKKFGFKGINSFKLFIIFFIIVFIICLIESILLSIFNANTIFVI